MNFKKNGGFTLVELIVVIAILGLLAGIGIPAYSGYVEKAQIEVEKQNITMFHNAYVVACVSNGAAPEEFKTVGINMTDAGVFTGLSSLQRGGDPNQIVADFNAYFGFPQASYEFKHLADQVADGIKNGLEGETIKVSYGDGEITMTKEQINKLLNSTFYGENLGSEKLMAQIDNVVGVASGMGMADDIMVTPEYTYAALSALGLAPSNDPAENKATLDAKINELAREKLGVGPDDPVDSAALEAEAKKIKTNALVLYTAYQTTQMGDSAKSLLVNGDGIITSDMIGQGFATGNKQTAMNQAALTYGMYFAYVNSSECTNESIKGDTNISALEVMEALDKNTEFQNYMKGEQGQKDMEAYLNALEIINSSTQSPEAVEKLVKEGFESDELVNILQQTMGK